MPYLVEALPPSEWPAGAFVEGAWRVTRPDPDDAKSEYGCGVYTVSRHRPGRAEWWKCTCGAGTFLARRRGNCKHALGVQGWLSDAGAA